VTIEGEEILYICFYMVFIFPTGICLHSSAFTTIVTLLIEMAGTRHKPKKKDYGQKELFTATG